MAKTLHFHTQIPDISQRHAFAAPKWEYINLLRIQAPPSLTVLPATSRQSLLNSKAKQTSFPISLSLESSLWLGLVGPQ